MENKKNGFLPDGYEAPKSSSMNYFKIEKGENRIRILSRPIVGWLDWKDNKPLRFRMENKPQPVDPKRPVRHFWAMVVWNYKTESIQVMEITQATIQHSLSTLSKDKDWGNPFGYDIKIGRSGDGMETSYIVNPIPHKPLSNQIQLAIQAIGEIKLDNLYDGKDPFENANAVTIEPETSSETQQDDGLPF